MRPLRTLLLCLPLLSLLPGCPVCPHTTYGDVSQPLEVRPALLQRSGSLLAVEDGGPAPIFVGGQGGMMLLVGAAANNVDTCELSLEARLVDPDTGEVVSRARNFSTVEEDGQQEDWVLVTEMADQYGLVLFPCDGNSSTGRPGVGVPWRVEVTLTDAQGRTATGASLLTPTCEEGDTWCVELCGGTP